MQIKYFFLIGILALVSCGPSNYYLVRHAEKMDDSTDPPLSPAGELRAQALKEKLLPENIDLVYATDYQRTRQTAEPLANALNMETTIYDAKKTWFFAYNLKKLNRINLLVVGHSNTIPEMVEILSGDTVLIAHDQYNQLFHIQKKRGFFKDNYKLVEMTYGN